MQSEDSGTIEYLVSHPQEASLVGADKENHTQIGSGEIGGTAQPPVLREPAIASVPGDGAPDQPKVPAVPCVPGYEILGELGRAAWASSTKPGSSSSTG